MNVNLRIQESYSLALAASCSWTRSKWYSLPWTTCKDIVWNISDFIENFGWIHSFQWTSSTCLHCEVASCKCRLPIEGSSQLTNSPLDNLCLMPDIAQLQEDVQLSCHQYGEPYRTIKPDGCSPNHLTIALFDRHSTTIKHDGCLRDGFPRKNCCPANVYIS